MRSGDTKGTVADGSRFPPEHSPPGLGVLKFAMSASSGVDVLGFQACSNHSLNHWTLAMVDSATKQTLRAW